MNVSGHGESSLTTWLRKVKWVFIAVLAPEFVAYVALQQWARAIAFRKKLNKLREEHYETEKLKLPNAQKPEPFGKTYAFYAVMGGFCAEIGFMHDTLTRVNVTTEGLLVMARNGQFVAISGDSIRDKSKADLLAKGLVIFQVLWLAGQAIERKVAGYPVTLLEIHTLVHIVCALCMFALWLYKPFNVRDPTVVNPGEDGKVQECLAWMILSSSEGHLTRDGSVPDISYIYTKEHQAKGTKDCRVELNTSEEQTANVTTYFHTIDPISGCAYSAFDISDFGSQAPSPVCSLVGGQGLKNGFGLECDWPINAADPERGRLIKTSYQPDGTNSCLRLSAKDIRRLDYAANFVRGLESRFPEVFQNNVEWTRMYYDCIDLSDEELHNIKLPVPLRVIGRKCSLGTSDAASLTYRERNVRDIFSDSLTSSRMLGGALGPLMVLVPAAYGAIHLGALSVVFPTEVEHLLWEISCYILIGVAGGLAVLLILQLAWMRLGPNGFRMFGARLRDRLKYTVRIFPRYTSFYARDMLGILWDPPLWKLAIAHFLGLSIHAIIYAVGILYIAARAYIIIESFISMRHVPIGVYETPHLNFMNYVPHLWRCLRSRRPYDSFTIWRGLGRCR
ncbi:hypothetical protein MMC30_006041 [Trapelia coarctata]|nr:hypothetical protein [Trapelia coarctata]